jgi:hypothetical protein
MVAYQSDPQNGHVAILWKQFQNSAVFHVKHEISVFCLPPAEVLFQQTHHHNKKKHAFESAVLVNYQDILHYNTLAEWKLRMNCYTSTG